MKKNYLIALVLVLITMLSTTVFAASFSDLQKGHWAYEPIMEMANKGILNGYPDGTFLPDKSITRAEFAKILVLALDLETNGKNIEFQDVSSNHWSYKYVQAAAKYLSAYRDDRNNLMYMPDAKAVREDVAVAIVIASGHENDKYSLKSLDKFSDKDQISSNLRKYVAIAVENGLMSGHSNGTFEPRGYLTRAQVSKLMKNIEEVKDKVAIKDTDDSDTTTENYFDDISFDNKTLKLDLGENWDKYQYCVSNRTSTIYVPAQRYLNYNESASGKDKKTGYKLSNMYGLSGKEKITLKIMLKDNPKKYTNIQLRNPFYVSRSADKVYTNSVTGERYIEQIVEATNKLVKAEYQINNGSWIDATNSINNKKVDIIVNVEKYSEDHEHKFNIVLIDEYGNKWQRPYYFTIEKEYFTDIKFNSKTLELDLGENWDKYQYCPIKHEKTIYVPSQRYLKYQNTTSVFMGKDKETGNPISSIYGYFSGGEKQTFKIMLKSDKKTYTTLTLTDPFYASKLASKVYTNSNTGERYVEEVVVATNKLVKAEYKIDNESWIDATSSISNKKADIIVNVEKYDDEAKHEINIRLTDEYGNVCTKKEEFSMKKEYFTDIRFNNETLELDLGENWDKYLYGKGGNIYAPSQRYLTYEYKERGDVKTDKETGYKLTCTYWYYVAYDGTPQNVNLRIMLKNDPKVCIIKQFKNPFWVIKGANTVYTNQNTNEKYVEQIVTAVNRLVKVEYMIDNGKWIEDANAINNNRSNLIINVEKYKDGQEHKIRTRLTDEFGNRSLTFDYTFKCE